MTIALQRVLT